MDSIAHSGRRTPGRGFCAAVRLHRHLPVGAEPPAEGLARSRELLEKIAGVAFPASFSDTDALLIGTGRRAPGDAEKTALGELAAKLPLVLG